MSEINWIFNLNLAMRYGNRPLYEATVERMNKEGIPTEGFKESFDDLWKHADTSAEAAYKRAEV